MELPSISMGVANLSLRHDMFINEVKGAKGQFPDKTIPQKPKTPKAPEVLV